jgi:hypothetical protein
MPMQRPSGPNSEEMLAAVQPDRLQLGEDGADGGRAHAVLGQVHADPGDEVSPAVGPVDRPVGVDHDAVLVGQHGEIAGAGQGPRQALQHRSRRQDQLPVLVDHAVPGLGRNQLETQLLVGQPAAGDAAAPGPFEPGLDCGRRATHFAAQHGAPGVADELEPVARRR